MGRRRAIIGGFTAAVCALWSLSAGSALGAVTISPLAGTPDATPDTQISVLGTAAANITSVSVTGDSSGAHAGHLEPYSSGQGASFILDTPLSEGENVNVTVQLTVGGPLEES